jgi:hypothetical protein
MLYMQHRLLPTQHAPLVCAVARTNQPSLFASTRFATRRDTIRDGLIKPENANPNNHSSFRRPFAP